MLDQMFTPDNFRRIFDTENRKGQDLAQLFFPEVHKQTFSIKEAVSQLRELKKTHRSSPLTTYDQQREIFKAHIRELKTAKSRFLDKELEKICEAIESPTFQIKLEAKIGPKGKKIYSAESSAEAFFLLKQIQTNLYKLYGVKQANRHDVFSQLLNTLNGDFPFIVVRTDIKDFYESVNTDRLMRKLDNDQLLSYTSKYFIAHLVGQYLLLSSSKTGIPRGIGISAYLAELFLREVDNEIRELDGLVLYCRYVDDIVAVFAHPPKGSGNKAYVKSIENIFANSNLKCNYDKTAEFDFGKQLSISIIYLGYQINWTKPSGSKAYSLQILLSPAKVEKLKKRIDLSFREYQRVKRGNPKRAFIELVMRIKFLTGNTRLANSKASAHTGIYFNNEFVNDLNAFHDLDIHLVSAINSLSNPNLQQRLAKFTFSDGFAAKRFHNFSFKQLRIIVRLWQHA